MSSIPWASFFLCQPYNSPCVHPFGELFLCRPSLERVSFRADHSTVLSVYPFGELFLCRQSLERDIFVPTIQFSILWRVTFMSTISLSIRPSLWRVIFVLSIPCARYFPADHLILQSLASYFRADHIILHPSILLASCFCAVRPLGKLFLCLLFNFSILLSIWRVIFVHCLIFFLTLVWRVIF